MPASDDGTTHPELAPPPAEDGAEAAAAPPPPPPPPPPAPAAAPGLRCLHSFLFTALRRAAAATAPLSDGRIDPIGSACVRVGLDAQGGGWRLTS